MSGNIVTIKGRLLISFESNTLSAISDYQGADKSQIWVGLKGLGEFPFQKLSGKNVVIRGKFIKGKSGHLGGWSGQITEIESIEELK